MQTSWRFASAACVLVLAGCANVKVTKVNDPANQPEGLPFYLPRPYVQVYEPFVIASEVFLASGQLADDGKYLMLDKVGDKLKGILATDPSADAARIPAGSVRVPPPRGGVRGAPQMGEDTTGAKKPDGDKPKDAPGDKPAPQPASGGDAAPVGQSNTKVTQSSVPFPSVLGRRFFDVVWMPDFEEKYVIQRTQGLGNSDVGVTMVQGWGLYGMEAKVDNSALVKPLLDFYSTGLDALSQLAKSKILPGSALPGAPQMGAADGTLPADRALAPGARVSVKITRVTVAAPGLYPVLKPSEVKKAAETTPDGSTTGRVLVPQRPYTNVAFNTYDVLVIEAARPEGDSPMNLQRYFDNNTQGSSGGSSGGGAGGAPATDAAGLASQVNAKLAGEKGTDGAFWVVSDVRIAGGKITGKATLTGGKAKPARFPDMKSLIDFMALESGVSSANIDIKQG